MSDPEKRSENLKIWKSIAWIASAFTLVTSILLIVNFIQINRLDPVNTTVIENLVERLQSNPGDDALRNEIRELDLLARKAYFTNERQIRTGGYIVLASILLLILAMQFIAAGTEKLPAKSPDKLIPLNFLQKSGRKMVTIGGVSIAALALILAFLSSSSLQNGISKKLSQTENADSIVATPIKTHAPKISQVVDANTDSAEIKSDTLSKAEEDETQTENIAPSIFPTSEMWANFPSFRGPGSNGIDVHKNIPVEWDGASGKNIKWHVKIPVHGYSSPIIWGAKVIVTGANASGRFMYCYNTTAGELLWSLNIADNSSQVPEVTDDTGLSAPTPATDGKHIVAIFGTGEICASDMNGKRLWYKNLGTPDNHYGHSSSLLIYKNMVIVQYDQKKSAKVMALSIDNGEVVWSTDRKVKVSWSSPVLVNTGSGNELFLISEPDLVSYDPESGKELWKVKCTYGEVGPSVAYGDGVVVAQNEYANLCAIGTSGSHSILWEDNEYLSDVPSPVIYNGMLFEVTSYGVVVCYNVKTGEKYWENDFGTGFYASPMISDSKLFLLDRKGVMHIIDPGKSFKIIAEPALGIKSDCTPAFKDGQIFIRADNELFCIGN